MRGHTMLPADIEMVVGESLHLSTLSLERIQQTRLCLETLADHVQRMIDSIQQSRERLAKIKRAEFAVQEKSTLIGFEPISLALLRS